MKYIYLILALTFFLNSHAQQVVPITTFNQGNNDGKYFKDNENASDNFVGTWEGVTGITTFRVVLHKATMKPMGSPVQFYIDAIEGRFQIIKNAGTPNEVVIHNSVKQYPTITSFNVIFGITYDGLGLGGDITDTCASGGGDVLTGFFTMDIIDPNSQPVTAHWKIKSRPQLQGEYYSVPTDIILVKVL
ncbi:MAG TPA: DUF6705 family protein [Flavobacterium sp.]|jgi:hypothetical protein